MLLLLVVLGERNMLIDTHCHINIIIKKDFDRLLILEEFPHAAKIIEEAVDAGVSTIINVGTSLIESINCVELAKSFDPVYAAVGIHPNDCTATWHHDLKEMERLWFDKELRNIKIIKLLALVNAALIIIIPIPINNGKKMLSRHRLNLH